MTSKIQIFDHPWRHIVIDDYLDPEVFEDLKDDIAKLESPKHVSDGIETYEGIILQHIHCAFDEDIFKILNTHRDYIKLDNHHSINIAKPYTVYPIHDEAPRKVVSLVIYVYGGDEGTTLYDENQQYVKTIEWKPNRAFIFAGQKGITWHSYKSGAERRATANTFYTEVGR